jgi:uncharacterized SAM-binding protein YcdF (DUF218 family)
VSRLLVGLGVAGLAAWALAACTPLPNLLADRVGVAAAPDPGTADAVVVLGAALDARGVLIDESLRRLVTAVRLVHRGAAPRLVLSSSGPDVAGGPIEAEVQAQLARDLGVPAAAIVTLVGAHTTREEGQALEVRLARQGVRRVFLVTDPLHVPRARAILGRAGLEVVPASTDHPLGAASRPWARVALMRDVVGALLAQLYYRAAGYA